MMFSFMIVLLAAVFLAQLLLCRNAKRLWVRLIPTILIILGELVCLALYAVSVYLEGAGQGIYGAAFAAVIYAALLMIFLVGDGLAWGIWGIYQSVQKRRK